MNCSRCGLPIGPGQTNCPSCGTPVQGTSNLNNNSVQSNTQGMGGFTNIPSIPTIPNVPVNPSVPDFSNGFGMPDNSMMNNQFGYDMQGFQNNNMMMNVVEPSNVNLATDAKRKVQQPNNMMNNTGVQNNNMFGFVEPSNVNLATDAKRKVQQPNNTMNNTGAQNNNSNMFGFAEPSNINLANDGRNNNSNQASGHIDPSVMASSLVNPPTPSDTFTNNQSIDTKTKKNKGEQNGMYYGDLELPDENDKKKKIPWFAIAGVLVAIMVVGVFILPLFNKFNLSTYEADQYTLKYNANWNVDEEKDDMTLYYSDNNSRFIFNALSTFKALNSSVENEAGKKDLYNQFYSAWSGIEDGELTGGTETFLPLTGDTLYARVDFASTNNQNVGSFYVIVSEKNDKVIVFMTYCTSENKKQIDKDVLDMLESVTYKKESESSIYDKFKSGETKSYTALGYMKYDVPDCWTFDENRTKSVQYKSNIFKFIDGLTLIDIKGATIYDSSTASTGTSYNAMKNSIVNTYGAIKSETKKSFNGKVWYIITTPDYDDGGMSYHNEFYFTMSATNKHLYYIGVFVSNETSEKKTKYLRESIEYIINSAELYKVDQ